VSGISQAENESRLIVELPLDPQAPSPEWPRRLMLLVLRDRVRAFELTSLARFLDLAMSADLKRGLR
jgi:hypothetical protein